MGSLRQMTSVYVYIYMYTYIHIAWARESNRDRCAHTTFSQSSGSSLLAKVMFDVILDNVVVCYTIFHSVQQLVLTAEALKPKPFPVGNKCRDIVVVSPPLHILFWSEPEINSLRFFKVDVVFEELVSAKLDRVVDQELRHRGFVSREIGAELEPDYYTMGRA